MAKTESTAVNNLIDLVNTNQRSSKPIVHPDDDLFANPPPQAKKQKTPSKPLPTIPKVLPASTSVQPPRMTASLPMPRTEIPALPRTRAPNGTSPAPMRTTTAPPPRGNTIPPIPNRSSSPAFPQKVGQPVFSPVADGTPPPVLTNPAAPVTKPSSSELFTKSATAPVNSAMQAVAPLTYPVVPRVSKIDMTGDAVLGENWFESSRAVEKFEDETYVGTSPHVKQERERDKHALVKKLILPAIGFIIVGACIGGFIAFNSDKKPVPETASEAKPESKTEPKTEPKSEIAATPAVTPANAARAQAIVQAGAAPIAAVPTETARAPVATATPAEPAVAPNPAIHEIQTTRGVVHLADVRIDTKPAGASVTLTDENGKSSFLGTTPLATSLDAAHAYDLTITLAGRPDQTAHLDPSQTQHLEIDMPKAGKPEPKHEHAAPVAAPIAAPVVVEKHVAAPTPAAKHHVAAPAAAIVDPSFEAPKSEPKSEPKSATKEAAGNGTLMISSKPPCEILVDGKPTGLSTPQRAMALPAGAHKITLVNAAQNISKTVMVQITADQPTRLVKDLLAN